MANQINLRYASAKEILARTGYSVSFMSYEGVEPRQANYVIVTDIAKRNVVTAFNAGNLSAASLNHYLVYHHGDLFKYSALFALDGGVGARIEIGTLSADFPLAAVGDRAPGYQMDSLVHERFLSVSMYDYEGFEYNSEAVPWTKGIKIFPAMPFKARGRRVEFEYPRNFPFYYVVKEIDPETVEALQKEEKLFVAPAEEGLFVVSNWDGAQYYLPPNAIVLGNKVVDMARRAPDVPERVETKLKKVPSSTSLVSNSGDDVEVLFEVVKKNAQKFLEKPNFVNYRAAFVGNKKFTEFTREAKRQGRVDTGSRQRPVVSQIRDSFEGGTWGDLWQLTQDLTSSEMSAFYVFGNLNSQVHEKNGGPVFKI